MPSLANAMMFVAGGGGHDIGRLPEGGGQQILGARATVSRVPGQLDKEAAVK
jgi:hypothetical protein